MSMHTHQRRTMHKREKTKSALSSILPPTCRRCRLRRGLPNLNSFRRAILAPEYTSSPRLMSLLTRALATVPRSPNARYEKPPKVRHLAPLSLSGGSFRKLPLNDLASFSCLLQTERQLSSAVLPPQITTYRSPLHEICMNNSPPPPRPRQLHATAITKLGVRYCNGERARSPFPSQSPKPSPPQKRGTIPGYTTRWQSHHPGRITASPLLCSSCTRRFPLVPP